MGFLKRAKAATINTSMSPKHSVRILASESPAVERAELDKLGESGVNLKKAYDKAGVSLSKRSLTGFRGEVVMLLDYSLSMSGFYQNGTVAEIVRRSLGFALQIDKDGKIPVFPFASDLKKAVEVDRTNYTTVVVDKIHRGGMGSTNLTAALQELLKIAKKAKSPIYCIIVTDGYPDYPDKDTQLICELASYPVFIKILSVGSASANPFPQELDDLPDTVRLLDNVDSQYIDNPSTLSDLEFADAMTEELPEWVALGKQAGVLIEA